VSEPVRVLTAHWDDPSVIPLKGYEAAGGYRALRSALAMSSGDLVQVMKDSGLRGRGGAGFPTGMKWSFVPQDTGKPTYVTVNFDESEPGTCNNRELVEREPHALIEGTAIAARAIECHTAFIYVRGEYLWQGLLVQRAVEEAYAAGYLGKDIMGSAYDLDIVVHRGAGAYICGEETALLSSLEGFRGQPRLRPPFPAVEGLYESPTLINNVETLMNVPHIVANGADWFKSMGTEKAPGTKMFTVSGKVERPGNYELPLGTPFGELLELAGGMLGGARLKAWTPGGSSTPFLTADHMDVGLDFESISEAGSLLGTGAVIVLDESDCMVEAARRLTEFYAHESCGKCTPCREGTWWAQRVLSRIEQGYGREADIPLMADMGKNILFKAFCALADGAVSPIQSSLRYFMDEYEAHVREGRCPVTGVGPGRAMQDAAGELSVDEVVEAIP
jgi:NADH-quinone oxidoreductase subunit F